MNARRIPALLCVLSLLAAACVTDAPVPLNEATPPTVVPPSSTEAPRTGDIDEVTIDVVSSDPTRITGGDARIRISGARSDATVELNGEDVTAAFSVIDGGELEGVVTGLGLGNNALAVTSNEATFVESLVNYPRRGPVFSGPQTDPLVCSTALYGLGGAVDTDCSAPTQTFWTYLNTEGGLASLDRPIEEIDDIATITVDGQPVPAVIRNEVGTINRGIYWIHILDDQPVLGPTIEPWAGSAWNGRLVFRYSGGCGATYSQGLTTAGFTPAALGGPVDVELLRQGYALATSTMTTFQTHCNDVVAAETTMMVKERFIEGYGAPDLTIGSGGSGGAIQQFLIAQNYPGLLDAIYAPLPFADWLTTQPGISDCGLLTRYFASARGFGWTPEQITAVYGHLSGATCPYWDLSFVNTIDPAVGCQEELEGQAFDPVDNARGLRCTITDANPGLYGVDERTGVARRPLDNVGVQYGLQALLDGELPLDQFLDLNEFIGSWSIDGIVIPGRVEADVETLERMYAEGRVNQAGGDLRRIPIILHDIYTDPAGDIHDRWRSMSIMERIGGGSEPPVNVALWTELTGLTEFEALLAYNETPPAVVGRSFELQAVDALDEWATALIGSDGDSLRTELAEQRPAAAADRCIGVGGGSAGADATSGQCDLPVAGDPRTVAGDNVEALVLKCALQPTADFDYGDIVFDAAQRARLNVVFPDGVCDYGRPGVGQTRLGEPWQTYDPEQP